MTYPRVSLYAMMLAAAGIPLYIHLPLFASQSLGIDLAALGAFLLAIRLFDLVQDPAIGWAIDRWPRAIPAFGVGAALGLAVAFPILFALPAGPQALLSLALVLMALFSAYSLGTILLYGQSTALARTATAPELLRLAGFREAGTLAGVILAATLPTALVASDLTPQSPYPAFGLILGILAVATAILTRPLWRRPLPRAEQPLSLSALAQAGGLRLLGIALLNSLPVALTSTLFLFFAQDVLALGPYAGPLLALFFVCAGLSIPLWSRISRRIGPRATLLIAMPLAIAAFVGAMTLPAGNLIGFALICASSGAALGADMLLLPAMFSIALAKAGLSAGAAFGLWSFAGKSALALAAAVALPLLQAQGYTPGGQNAPKALATLTFAYAALPCLLKLAAFAAVLTLPSERSQP